MQTELKEQAIILENLEEEVDKADSGITGLNKSLRKLVDEAKSSDRAQYAIIACLLITLVVLTTMVLE